MKLRSFSTMAAGALLLVGAGAANASPLVTIGANGVAGDLTINSFLGTAPINMNFSNLTGNGGVGLPSLIANGQASSGTLNLFDPSWDLKFFYSPPLTTDVVPLQLSWNNATATASPDPLNLLSAAVNSTINITYSGGWSLMGQPLAGAGSLALTVSSSTANSFAFSVVENSTSGVSFREALIGFDLQGSPTNRGTIDGNFLVPEPASLSLMAIGLAGLGAARRQKKAA